ncbi:MAG TPA: MBL fold metallo-hydrolase [Bryobacteraceae bacterium]|jgi:beta-lactamase superfamily II metal-dependent hydrolase|nr:MBL fold metallo-hydrolase [Bryobacteraceae bacterium]
MQTCLLLFSSLLLLPVHAAKTVDFYFVDVEGGQATLIVTPRGESILVDSGWPGYNRRDADRIAAAAKQAGVKAIDYLITTHYHNDHVGGVAQLIEKLPVRTFVDHGPNRESGKTPEELNSIYEKALQTGKRLSIKPGDSLPLKDAKLTFVTADGNVIGTALSPSTGNNSQACSNLPSYPEDKSENARSVGFVLEVGKFRFADFGDLTMAKEMQVVCPNNLAGTVDLYVSNHHGLDTSNAPAFVNSLKPRVIVMNNGARKGGKPAAWKVLRSSPRVEDLWQVHFSIEGGKENNVPEPMIANLDENCEGKYLKVSATPDGSMTVLNSRNKYSKTYAAR